MIFFQTATHSNHTHIIYYFSFERMTVQKKAARKSKKTTSRNIKRWNERCQEKSELEYCHWDNIPGMILENLLEDKKYAQRCNLLRVPFIDSILAKVVPAHWHAFIKETDKLETHCTLQHFLASFDKDKVDNIRHFVDELYDFMKLDINDVPSERETPVVQVGYQFTQSSGSDKYGYIVTAVADQGRELHVKSTRPHGWTTILTWRPRSELFVQKDKDPKDFSALSVYAFGQAVDYTDPHF